LQKAVINIQAEIWVVDNASTDGSIEYLSPKFPSVKFIANTTNAGFAKANNKALNLCSGRWVLFLNPDTILPEDCLVKCIFFMEAKDQAGGLGIRMINGTGRFLPESKRSFPSPLTAFYKSVGLSWLFPASKVFSKYSLVYLDQHKNHEVDVLAGAFLMARRKLLVELKGFDEDFFMYGEDIDLSYRIQKSGFKNFYFSESTIIHFKGESTRKGSLNYVKMFYSAMSIFVKKHYSGTSASIFTFFIQVAIWLKASVIAGLNGILKIGLPLIDVLLIYAAFNLITSMWVKMVRHGQSFMDSLVNISLPFFTVLFMIAATLAGIYDRRYKPLKAFYAAFTAIIVLLAAYSLLPEKFRFSKGVVLFGGFTAMVFIIAFRSILLKWRLVEDKDELGKQRQTLIVGTEEEFIEVKDLFVKAGLQERIMGRIAVNESKKKSIGTLDELPTIVRSLRLREIVFCEGFLTYERIIELLQKVPDTISARFHAHGTGSIVGSDSKNTAGEIVADNSNFNISDPYERRMKRVTDVACSLLIWLTFPVFLLLAGYKSLVNAFYVLLGKKTWVGYSKYRNGLPSIPKGVIPIGRSAEKDSGQLTEQTVLKVDFWYAKNYHWTEDLRIILKSYNKLGND